jgi:hypothetical protein
MTKIYLLSNAGRHLKLEIIQGEGNCNFTELSDLENMSNEQGAQILF